MWLFESETNKGKRQSNTARRELKKKGPLCHAFWLYSPLLLLLFLRLLLYHHSMFKRKRDSDTQLDDNNDTNESSGNQDKQLRLQDHQLLACNDTTQTSVIDVENPKLFRQCTDPLEWNLIKFRDMRATHSRRAFGRVLYRKSLFPSMVLLHQHLNSLFDSSSTHVTAKVWMCYGRSISLLLSRSKEMCPFCLRVQQ